MAFHVLGLTLPTSHDVLGEQPPLQLQLMLELADAGGLLTFHLPAQLVEDALQLGAGRPAAPVGAPQLLGQLLLQLTSLVQGHIALPLQQLLRCVQLGLLPAQQLLDLRRPLPLLPLLQLLLLLGLLLLPGTAQSVGQELLLPLCHPSPYPFSLFLPILWGRGAQGPTASLSLAYIDLVNSVTHTYKLVKGKEPGCRCILLKELLGQIGQAVARNQQP